MIPLLAFLTCLIIVTLMALYVNHRIEVLACHAIRLEERLAKLDEMEQKIQETISQLEELGHDDDFDVDLSNFAYDDLDFRRN